MAQRKNREAMKSDDFLNELNLWPKIKTGHLAWTHIPNYLSYNISYVSDFYAIVNDLRYRINKEDETASIAIWSSFSLDLSHPHIKNNLIVPSSIEFDNKYFKVIGIGIRAFVNNTELVSIEIPNTIESIESYAFYGCTGIKEITCHRMTPPNANELTFGNVDCSSIDLIIPQNANESYETDPIWSQFNIIRKDFGEAGLSKIGTDNPSTAPVYYDLFGRRIQTPTSGQIVIVDGKKVIMP